MKAWRKENKASVRAYERIYRKNPKRKSYLKSYQKAYRARPAVLSSRLSYQRVWHKSPAGSRYRRSVRHKAYHAVYNSAYRHKRLAAVIRNGGSWTATEFATMCRKYGHRCACCGRRRKLTPDHIVPVSKGGRNVIRNLQPLCLPCNTSKNCKTAAYTCTCGRAHRRANRRMRRCE